MDDTTAIDTATIDTATIDTTQPAEVDAFDDDEFRRSLQRTRLVTPLTKGLLVALVGATGFFAGAWLDHGGKATTGGGGAALAAFAAARGGGTGASGASGPTGAGGTVFGTIKLIDGNNVYIEDASGTVTKITTDASTTVRVSKDGTVSDLKPSDTIVVQGSTGDDGTVKATSITSGAPGGGGRFGGGQRGGQGGGGATPGGGASDTQSSTPAKGG